MEMNRTEAEALQRPSGGPLIATLWTLSSDQEGNRTLYSRVAEDEATLALVKRVSVGENAEMSDFQPSLAVIITWHRNTLVCVCMCMWDSYRIF